MNLKKALTIISSLIVLIISPSCSNATKHNYYLLSPAGPSPTNQTTGIGIGVGPIITAPYLDRPYLIFQSSENTLEINEDHEWAGDLHNEFARVLGTNIGRRAKTGNIQTYPWPKNSDINYQIAVDVKRFHGTSTGDAVLEASWRVYKLPSSRLVASKSATFTEPLGTDGFEALAAAQSRLVDQLSAKIASSIR